MIAIVWFGVPLTAMGAPSITRLTTEAEPMPAAPGADLARAVTRSASMVVPATSRARFAVETSETTWSGPPIVAAWRTSPVSNPGIWPVSADAPSAPGVPPRSPVPPSTVVIPDPSVPVAVPVASETTEVMVTVEI